MFVRDHFRLSRASSSQLLMSPGRATTTVFVLALKPGTPATRLTARADVRALVPRRDCAMSPLCPSASSDLLSSRTQSWRANSHRPLCGLANQVEQHLPKVTKRNCNRAKMEVRTRRLTQPQIKRSRSSDNCPSRDEAQSNKAPPFTRDKGALIVLLALSTGFLLLNSLQPAFASDGSAPTGSSFRPSRIANEQPPSSGNNRSASFVWQPLPLRATFRPLNRATAPEPLALVSEHSVDSAPPSDSNLFPAGSSRFESANFANDFFAPTRSSSGSEPPPVPTVPTSTQEPPTTVSPDIAAPPPPPSTDASTTLRPLIALELDAEDSPTRQPMTRFRPTKASVDDATSLSSLASTLAVAASSPVESFNGSVAVQRMPSECFECICEASTNCNANSRCQTSDVRHTRCGMFLISYDQWLSTGLSRELVSREALARDAAADERAFYDCVTARDCSERLLSIFMGRNAKDCNKDGRVDCYDYAAIHHSGQEACSSESLLDSQYWSDFNACLGFGR